MAARAIHITGIFDDGSDPRPKRPISAVQALDFAQGEDVDVYLTVLRPSGAPVDLTSSINVLTIKQRSQDGTALVARAFLDLTSAGTARAQVVANDSVRLSPGKYVFDVWTTIGGIRTQTVVTSNVTLRPATGPGSPITVPPMVPLPVLGLPPLTGVDHAALQEHPIGTFSWGVISGGNGGEIDGLDTSLIPASGLAAYENGTPNQVDLTDADGFMSARCIGVYQGVPGQVISMGPIPDAQFTTDGGAPVEGEPIYLARAGDDTGTGAGKFTAVIPAPATVGMSIASCGVCLNASNYAGLKTCRIQLTIQDPILITEEVP